MSALLSFEPSLRPALFDLIVRMARVDPMFGAPHVAAVRGARVALGLVDEPSLDDALVRGCSGDWRALRGASDGARSLAYAAARWVALADGVLDDAESALLASLRVELRLADPAVRLAETIANDVSWRARREGIEAHRAFAMLALESGRHAARRRALRAA